MRLNGQLLCITQECIQEIPLVFVSKTVCHWMSEDAAQSLLSLRYQQGHWYIHHAQNICLVDQKLNWNKLYPIQKDGQRCFLFPQSFGQEHRRFRPYALSKPIITIGRKAADIQMDDPYISNTHALIYQDGDHWILEDQNSTNGCYVNRLRVEKRTLEVCDCITIMGCELIMGVDFIMIYDAQNPSDLRIRLPPYLTRIAQPVSCHFRLEVSMVQTPYERFDFHEIELQDPPPRNSQERQPLIYLLGPSLMMCTASFSSTLFMIVNNRASNQSWAQSMPSIIMSGSMVIGSLIWPILTLRYERRKERKQEEKRSVLYQNYLKQKQREMLEQFHKVKKWLSQFYIVDINQPLWKIELPTDRMITMLGIGTIYLQAPFKEQMRQLMIRDDPLDCLKKHQMESKIPLERIPLVITTSTLRCFYVDGCTKDRIDYANHLMLQHALLYPPDKLNIVICAPYAILIHFPHFLRHQFHEDSYRFLTHQTENLPSILMYLKRDVRPSLVISFQEEFTSFFLTYGHDLPLALYAFHSHSSYEITLHQTKGSFQIADMQIPFHWKARKDQKAVFEQLCKCHRSTQSAQFPEQIGLLELYQVQNIHQLSIWELWQRTLSENSLHIPIGIRSDGGILELDLHEKAHGPHGIIAGMTGSGKSECLIVLLLSLAISYHPYDCAFILIDYKGGGMAKALERLPHCAGVITNLDGSLIQRSLNSLNSELIRRQQLFQKAMEQFALSSMDIDSYQRLFHTKKVEEPLPHLVIVADEFAELKQQEPQVMEQLIRMARIGRSLGIHLILATQKPSGIVDDQIWSNARFHICLKVAQKQDSMDMLKKEDGAKIKAVGRFFLQVGYDEIYTEGQSAYAKAFYDPSRQDERMTKIREMLEDGSCFKEWKREQEIKTKPTQLSILTEHMCTLAQLHKIQPIRLWQEVLEEVIDASKVAYRCIAMVDDPTHQRQFPLLIDDCIHPTLFLASDPECMKEAIRTMMISLSQIHTQLVLFDMDGTLTKDMRLLPTMYASISLEHMDDIRFMMYKIEQESDSVWFLFIHQIAILLEVCEDAQTWLLTCIRNHRIHLFMSATSIDEVPFRLIQQCSQYMVFQLNDQSQGYQLIPGSWTLPSFPLRAMRKYKEEVYEIQFITYQNLPHSVALDDHSMPCLPAHIFQEDLKEAIVSNNTLMIGISHQTRKFVRWEMKGEYIISGYEGYSFFQLLKAVCKQTDIDVAFYIGIKEHKANTAMHITYLSPSELMMASTKEEVLQCKEEGHLLWCGNRWEDIRYLWNLQQTNAKAWKQDALLISQEVNVLRRIETKHALM